MKIFFICNWFPNRNSPAEGLFLKYTSEAISLYDDVTVFYANEDASLSNNFEQVNTKSDNCELRVAYYQQPQTFSKLLNAFISSLKRIYHLHLLLQNEIKKQQPDIIHFNIVSPSIVVAWWYSFFYRIPLVYSEHWDIPLRVKMGLQKKWLLWRIGMKLCSMSAARVIVCSHAMKNVFAEFGFCANAEIIGNVVTADNKNIDDNKRLYQKKIFLQVSSLANAQKNVSQTLEVIAQVAEKRNDFEFHFIGSGSEIEEHRQHALLLGLLNKTIFFHGFVSDEEKRNWYEKSICHVLFSNFEGFSVATADAIYYGRPVIISRCGGPEDFVNESNGILVEPKNRQQLADAMLHMLDNFEKYKPEELRNYGTQIFSSSAIGSKHHQLYQSVLNAQPS